jgi:predicted  nucleic acid-binding Zn-ribbon protein
LGLFGAPNQRILDYRKRSISESHSHTDYPLSSIYANEKPEKVKPVSLEDEIQHLKDTIQNRDEEIDKLRREIHKLKVG